MDVNQENALLYIWIRSVSYHIFNGNKSLCMVNMVDVSTKQAALCSPPYVVSNDPICDSLALSSLKLLYLTMLSIVKLNCTDSSAHHLDNK